MKKSWSRCAPKTCQRQDKECCLEVSRCCRMCWLWPFSQCFPSMLPGISSLKAS